MDKPPVQQTKDGWRDYGYCNEESPAMVATSGALFIVFQHDPERYMKGLLGD